MNRNYIDGTLHEICISEAMKSPCQKRQFGAILFYGGSIIGVDHNRPIPGLEFICDPRCLRLDIPSGTDSMIGSCGHAEEWLIWEATREGIDLTDHVLYVAGIGVNLTPITKSKPSFYCIRCAVAMTRAHTKGVHVYANDNWHFLTAQEAVRSSLNFALGKEKA